MKVLHIGKYFPPRYGGIETFMSQLMEEQANQGLAVSALVHADELQSDSGAYEWKGCQIFEVKCYGQLVFAPIAPLYPFKLVKALQQENPDILHIHMPNLSAFWILLLSHFFSRNSKIFIHWHADVLGSAPTRLVRLFYPIYRFFETWMLRKADKVIATSPPYLETSVPLQPFKGKCEVVPLGIKIQEFDIRSKKYFSDGVLRLSMIGRLSYYKGHFLVLEALKQLKEKNISIHLDVIGDGELKSSLHNVCSQLGINDIVTWHGSVGESIKEDILKKSHLLLLPSLERTEAFGVVLLEAANFGVPSIVSDVEGSGMQYVVAKNITGIVVKRASTSSLSGKLIKLYEERDLFNECGTAAFFRLHEQFNIKHIGAKIKNSYQMISRMGDGQGK